MSKTAFQEYSPGEVIRSGQRPYRVEETIARGKFGSAFACRDDQGFSRILQVVWPFSRSYESLRERWSGQAAELQRLRHPDLVDLVDSFEHAGCFHLVHERCDHRLDQCLTAPGWDGARWAGPTARAVLGALDHVHRAGYLHRNLHPHNVFCANGPGGAIKLADLAVNTLLGNVDVLNAKIPRWLVPPEYLNPSECGPMDHRVDIYQAGLLLLCVLRGRIVQYSFAEISTGLAAKDAAAIGSPYGQVLSRALQPRVEDRFQSASELRRAWKTD